MKRSYYRMARIAVAAVVLAAITALFITPSVRGAVRPLLAGQFAPALLAGGWVAVWVILVLTVLAGRCYCSWLCPLGIFQDLLGLVTCHRRRPERAHRKTRWAIFGLVVGAAACGGWAGGLVWTEPYSLYGRMVRGLVPGGAVPLVLINTIGAGAIVLLLAALVRWRGRFFCNVVCPVGTLLSGVAARALFAPRIDPARCRRCGQCVRSCNGGCIDLKKPELDTARCLMCGNCLNVCPFEALRFGRGVPRDPAATEAPCDPERRRILIGTAVAVGAGTLLGAVARSVGKPAPPPILPPGAQSLDRFVRRCTGCNLCIASCPTHIIRPAVEENGLAGVLLPTVRFDDDPPGCCDYECNICTRICPNGALGALSLAAKKRCRIGIAVYDPRHCIAQVDHAPCGACAEHCPTLALTMVPGPVAGVTVPHLDADYCIGCGACQYACPVLPTPSMTIRALPAQELAASPRERDRTLAPATAATQIPF